jgi:hypothetical protein
MNYHCHKTLKINVLYCYKFWPILQCFWQFQIFKTHIGKLIMIFTQTTFVHTVIPHAPQEFRWVIMVCSAKPRCTNFLWEKYHYINKNIYGPPLPSLKIHKFLDGK